MRAANIYALLKDNVVTVSVKRIEAPLAGGRANEFQDVRADERLLLWDLTLGQLLPQQLVVAYNGLYSTIYRVLEVHTWNQMNPESLVDYDWIISRVDFEAFDARKTAILRFTELQNEMTRRKKQADMIAAITSEPDAQALLDFINGEEK